MKKLVLASLIAMVSTGAFAEVLGDDLQGDKDVANAEEKDRHVGGFFGWDGTGPDHIYDGQTDNDGMSYGPEFSSGPAYVEPAKPNAHELTATRVCETELTSWNGTTYCYTYKLVWK